MLAGQEAGLAPLRYVIDIILREAKKEDRLVKQLLYTMLSAYTNNPINLAINAPSGEGKSHTIGKVAEKFPEADVIVYAGMSDKALFHRRGELVVKNEKGQYQSIEETIEKIDSDIQDKENEIAMTTNRDLKQGLRHQISQLQKSKKELMKDAKKLIDLQHKILIFLDTPSPKLFEAMMPLLSHDKYEIDYDYVDTSNGIKTKSNVLRGWPAVIFAQAIDYSHYQRFPEIQRRFIVTNPKMSIEKYREAIGLTSLRFGVPDFVYQAEVVSDGEKVKAREIIQSFKERTLDIAARYPPGKHNVFIPFSEGIAKALPSQKAFDMTTANRFFTFLSLLPIINYDQRPRLIIRKEGSPDMQMIPMATFQDLQESMFLMEYANGVRPYILEWFNEVFLPAFQKKTEPDSRGDRQETRIALTTEQLTEATYEKQKKKLSTKQIQENFINPLVNQGYIEKADSEIDKRSNIYYPVINVKQKKLFDSDQSNNYLETPKIPIRDIADFPTQLYITSKIEALSKYSTENRVYRLQSGSGEEKTPSDIASAYYSDAEAYFEAVCEGRSDEYPKERESSPVSIKEPQKYSIANVSNTLEGEKFTCLYCDYIASNRDEYENHIIISHPGKPGYPSM